LLAAVAHTAHAVPAQVDVDIENNEITAFQPLLDGLNLTCAVLTAEALHTQREHVDDLVTAKKAAIVEHRRHHRHTGGDARRQQPVAARAGDVGHCQPHLGRQIAEADSRPAAGFPGFASCAGVVDADI
jgi:hypothetical protein